MPLYVSLKDGINILLFFFFFIKKTGIFKPLKKWDSKSFFASWVLSSPCYQICSFCLPKLFSEVHKGLRKSLSWAFAEACFHHRKVKGLFSPILQGKKKQNGIYLTWLILRDRKLRVNWTGFKNHWTQSFRRQTIWKPTLSDTGQTASSNMHSPGGRFSICFIFSMQDMLLQKEKNRSLAMSERNHSSTWTTASEYHKTSLRLQFKLSLLLKEQLPISTTSTAILYFRWDTPHPSRFHSSKITD